MGSNPTLATKYAATSPDFPGDVVYSETLMSHLPYILAKTMLGLTCPHCGTRQHRSRKPYRSHFTCKKCGKSFSRAQGLGMSSHVDLKDSRESDEDKTPGSRKRGG